MKTQLPEKLSIIGRTEHDAIIDINFALNQYHDYLAELTEVVDGKQCKCNISPDSVHYKDCPLVTLTLKEQLLNNLKDGRYRTNPADDECEDYVVDWGDVEVTINRLIP